MYKGKSGENFRIYTCRVLECFALCNLPLSDKHIACFTVINYDNSEFHLTKY